jgi:hypothetical protein
MFSTFRMPLDVVGVWLEADVLGLIAALVFLLAGMGVVSPALAWLRRAMVGTGEVSPVL